MAKERIAENKSEGYIKIFRSLKDHWLWQDPVKFMWWIDILLTVNHTDKKVQIGFELIDCNRGQTVKSLQNWAKDWRVDVSTVRRFFKMLTDDRMILLENLKKTTRLTVCKYDSYNDPRHAKQSPSNSDAIQTQFRDNTNNNVKNDNNDKNVFMASPSQIEKYNEFLEWVKVNAPRVLQMKEPLTLEQFCKATDRFGKIGYMVKKMHNYEPLLKKNRSAYLTLVNWIENQEHRQAS